MMEDRKRISGAVELCPAEPEQEPILADLMDAYAREFSAIHPVQFGPDGRFVYNGLQGYWSDPEKHAFLIRVDGVIAGFVLVKSTEGLGRVRFWDVAEFFVAKAYRRSRTGSGIAHRVWERFPGPWEVRVLHSNRGAMTFWEHAIEEFTCAPARSVAFEKDGELWQRFSFESRNRSDIL